MKDEKESIKDIIFDTKEICKCIKTIISNIKKEDLKRE